MHILLIRHGETTDNALNILQGHKNGKLSELGKKQANNRGKLLANTKIDFVISSDLGRSIETANIINGYVNATRIIEPLLKEKDWGSLTGKDISHYYAGNFPKDIENDEMLFNRAQKLISKLTKDFNESTIALIGHGAINVAIKVVLMRKSVEYMQEIPIQENLDMWETDI